MTLNSEMALTLRYFTKFGNGSYFAIFHRIHVRCRHNTIVRLIFVSKSAFDSLGPYYYHLCSYLAII